MYAKHPEIAKKFEAHTPAGKKLPEYASDYDEVGWTHINEIALQNRQRKESIKKERPSPNQTIIKEFQEEKQMITPQSPPFFKGNGLKWNEPKAPVQGNNQQTRGTQMTTVPTQPVPLLKPTGALPNKMSPNNNPLTRASDNVGNAVNRKVQANFNTGPNGVNNMTGLSNRTPQERMEINRSLTESLGGKSHNAYNANTSLGKPERSKSALVSFFGLEDENHVGNGVNTQTMFQDSVYKKSKPTEVMQCMTQNAPISGSNVDVDKK